MVVDTVEMAEIRGENFNRAVIGFALQEYKLKQICLNQGSNKWTETYTRETAGELSGAGTRSVKGVSRLANLPYGEQSWTPESVRHEKHAMEGVISIEDIKTSNIDVQSRTLERIGRAVANSVDSAIYSVITSDTDVNTAAAVSTWDNPVDSAQNPIKDILIGMRNIGQHFYDPRVNGFLLLNEKDYANLLVNSKVVNNPSFKTADVVSNGKVGQVASLNIIVSETVDADEAAIVVGQVALTWKSLSPLTTQTIEDPAIKVIIRGWEFGKTVVTNPKAIHIITSTAE